jgi:hypothetical protein
LKAISEGFFSAACRASRLLLCRAVFIFTRVTHPLR